MTLLSAFTLFHVLISLVGIASGFVVMADFLRDRLRPGWTRTFLIATLGTSLTGFLFPYHGFTPALGFGIVSVISLTWAVYAWRVRRLAGGARKAYWINAIFSQYLNVFVLVVQLFQKVPALKAIAPSQSSPPFGIAQGIVLVGFIAWGIATAKRFRTGGARAASC